MKCQVCQQENKTGNTYTFLSTTKGETTSEKTGFKEYTYTTPYLLEGKKTEFVCRTCFLKSLLFSDVGLILIVVPLLSVITQMRDTFLESLIIGLFAAPLVLVIDIIHSGPNYFLVKYGDRALIRVCRKDPEYKDYELLDRAKAAKIGLIKGTFDW